MKHANCFPDVIHVHDWQTAPAIWSPDRPETTATALTIHNLQFGQDLIRRAMIECTFATTVSPTYAGRKSNTIHQLMSFRKENRENSKVFATVSIMTFGIRIMTNSYHYDTTGKPVKKANAKRCSNCSTYAHGRD